MLHQPSQVKNTVTKVLVTGGSGFIGSHLVKHLRSKGYEVFAPPSHAVNCLEAVSVNQFFSAVDLYGESCCVVHTAVGTGGNRVSKPTLETLSDTLMMYQNIQRAAEAYDVKLINFCSGAAFDRSDSIDNIKETAIESRYPKQHDFYGLAKNLIARNILDKAHEIGGVLNLRLFGCFGEGEPRHRLISSLLLNPAPTVDAPEKRMSFFYVKDVARVVEHMIPLVGQPGVPVDINLCYSGSDNRLTLGDIAARVSYLTGMPVATFKRNSLPTPYTGDGNRLQQLDIPLVGFEAGLREMITEMEPITGKKLVK